MKQIVVNPRGQIELCESELVPPPKNQILVQTKYSVISSGTESYMIQAQQEKSLWSMLSFHFQSKDRREYLFRLLGQNSFKKNLLLGLSTLFPFMKKFYRKYILNANYNPPPSLSGLPLGYSAAGVIISDPSKFTTEFSQGDRVACAGQPHAELLTVPLNLAAKIPDSVSSKEAAFTTLACIALQSIRVSDLQLGDKVAVVGTGLIGQILIQLLRNLGVSIIGLDLDEAKLQQAKAFGADEIINGNQMDEITRILLLTEDHGVDTTIITAATPNPKPLVQATYYTREQGTIILLGNVPIELPRDEIYRKEQRLLISRSYGFGRYDPTYEKEGRDYPVRYVRWTEKRQMQLILELLAEKRLNFKPLISKEYNIAQAQKAYEFLLNPHKANVNAILLKYPPNQDLNNQIENSQNSRYNIEMISHLLYDLKNPLNCNIILYLPRECLNQLLNVQTILQNSQKGINFEKDSAFAHFQEVMQMIMSWIPSPLESIQMFITECVLTFQNKSLITIQFQCQKDPPQHSTIEIFLGGASIRINDLKKFEYFGLFLPKENYSKKSFSNPVAQSNQTKFFHQFSKFHQMESM